MKLSEAWLREWVNPPLSGDALCQVLTMAGLEVEERSLVVPSFSRVCVGQVVHIQKHPKADRLNLCEVNIGTSKHLNIVCGASNVTVGMKAPVAMIDAVLPQMTITKTDIRGVVSEGMLCSAKELGMAEDTQGLLVLPEDAPIGRDIRDYLNLDDYIIDISVTPNRGDCLSIQGIAREVSTLCKVPLKSLDVPTIKSSIRNTLPTHIHAKALCPRYVGRIIQHVKADATTPMWLKERLNRSDIRSIHPIVDIVNYVMLELGQPMHAFDLNKIEKAINVRLAKEGERINLLEGSEKVLDKETLVIADDNKPLAIAGVMGGLDSSVTLTTSDIFLESAYFSPEGVAKSRQLYQLNSDAAYRYERGVDPSLANLAIERATQLILDIAGGEVGPIVQCIAKENMPIEKDIALPTEKINKTLGLDISDQDIKNIFKALSFPYEHRKSEWHVRIPLYRSDIFLPEDLIEEIARIHGYDKIPLQPLSGVLQTKSVKYSTEDHELIRHLLNTQGFHEVISYSFIDKKIQQWFDPKMTPQQLLNPISAEMNVMRTNLWPGLVTALIYNISRQHDRARLFEMGTCFLMDDKTLRQEPKLAGLIYGFRSPEQWGVQSRESDFYDLKGNLENFLNYFYKKEEIEFIKGNHPALHPGQTATIMHDNKPLGIMGAIHPALLQTLDVPKKIFVFEIDLLPLYKMRDRHDQEISKFPEIRRDIAILINQTIPAKEIQDTIVGVVGDWLKDIFIFDVYQGKGISPDLKSIALALILQHPTRTLVDEEVKALMDRVITTLKGQLGAELRS